MRANLPDKAFFIGKAIPARQDIVIREWIASGNDAHLFRSHSSELGRDVACKIIPYKNLQIAPDGSDSWKGEVHKANSLRNPLVVKVDHICEWNGVPVGSAAPSEFVDCIALISEFVEGRSLREFIGSKPQEISTSFIVQWLEAMFNLLFEMKQRSLNHGDLHAGNILVEDRSTFDLVGPPYAFRVTDFAVGDTSSEPRFKDDYLQLASVLSNLLEHVKYNESSPKDKFVFRVLRDQFLARHLQETDPTRDELARQPSELFRRLRELDAEYERTIGADGARLITPFDFLNCEQIGEAAPLLRALYSDRFLGLLEIESQNNVVVTGPRGCGKSTVFRSLSLEQRMRVSEASPTGTRYIGIYYRCDDLYFAFPRYKIPTREEAVDIPIHFVTATLLAKLLSSLEAWGKSFFEDDFKRGEASACAGLWAVLGIDPPRAPGFLTFKSIISSLDRERLKSAERQRYVADEGRGLGRSFGVDVLQKACTVLSDSFTFARERPIYFFIDDYSSPKVTSALQASLNRLFMQRASVCFFKLSTESPVSFTRTDLDEKTYVESREFVLHNLGLVYLRTDVNLKLAFIEDVFRRRLATSATPYPVKELQDLVGSNTRQNNNEMARAIRNGEKPPLWGKEILCSLCSGDIHYVIGLVGDMVREFGGPKELEKKEGTFKIPESVQNRSIREAAGNFLKNLRGVPRYGEKMVAIVEAFGNVANSHLKFFSSQNETGNPPKQATRIEPYEPFSLSAEAQALYDELLRYSVFIEDFRGKSRRGKVVPRLFLRRFLIPHFHLTFSTRDSIELEPSEFQSFLLEPSKFEQRLRIRSDEDAARFEKQSSMIAQSTQLSLDLDNIQE